MLKVSDWCEEPEPLKFNCLTQALHKKYPGDLIAYFYKSFFLSIIGLLFQPPDDGSCKDH